MLKNKRILIFVSGSIAVYKVLDLIRILRKHSALVRVIATKNALKFINPITFEALCNAPLLHDDNEAWDNLDSIESNPALNHIGYAKWAQIAIFAPASANSINKLANGIADNIYLSSALALRNIPKLIAPSANTFMLENKITQENLQKLKLNGFEIIESRIDLLACGDRGNGALASIDDIFYHIKKAIYTFYPLESNLDSIRLSTFWQDKNVIVTGGGSSEDIDDIRCISNNSSGIQASNLALALFYLGAKVRFITSKVPFILPSNIEIIRVKTSKNYIDSINSIIKNIESNDIYLFMVAAISDYIPEKKEGKIKKQEIGKELILNLKQNIDILESLKNKKLIKIGFKAECDCKNAIQNAKKILDSKGCKAVCLNIINEKNKAFGESKNEISFITKNEILNFSGDKFDIAMQICKQVSLLE